MSQADLTVIVANSIETAVTVTNKPSASIVLPKERPIEITQTVQAILNTEAREVVKVILNNGFKGDLGNQGPMGPPGNGLQINAFGSVEERDLYNSETPPFAFLDTTNNLLYLLSDTGWSDGITFEPGPAGESAYELAVKNGFIGSEAEWLVFLEGADGSIGPQGSAGLYTGPRIFVSPSGQVPDGLESGDLWITNFWSE